MPVRRSSWNVNDQWKRYWQGALESIGSLPKGTNCRRLRFILRCLACRAFSKQRLKRSLRIFPIYSLIQRWLPCGANACVVWAAYESASIGKGDMVKASFANAIFHLSTSCRWLRFQESAWSTCKDIKDATSSFVLASGYRSSIWVMMLTQRAARSWILLQL